MKNSKFGLMNSELVGKSILVIKTDRHKKPTKKAQEIFDSFKSKVTQLYIVVNHGKYDTEFYTDSFYLAEKIDKFSLSRINTVSLIDLQLIIDAVQKTPAEYTYINDVPLSLSIFLDEQRAKFDVKNFNVEYKKSTIISVENKIKSVCLDIVSKNFRNIASENPELYPSVKNLNSEYTDYTFLQTEYGNVFYSQTFDRFIKTITKKIKRFNSGINRKIIR